MDKDYLRGMLVGGVLNAAWQLGCPSRRQEVLVNLIVYVCNIQISKFWIYHYTD